MTTLVLLLLVGILLVGFEVFLPGGILGFAGGALMIGGCVMAFARFGAGGGLIAVLATLCLLGLVLWFEFKILPRTRVGSRLFLRSAVTGRSQPPVAQSAAVVGKSGVALTALAPTGYVAIDGKRYEAASRTGFLEQGSALTVVGVDTFRLIVQASSSDSSLKTHSS